MNTDNMSIAGETIDYGPCAFMDTYHPGTVFSSIDHGGRYAYGNQPRIAQWNLASLAEALLPLLGDDEADAVAAAQAAIDGFPTRFDAAWLAGMRAKLGLVDAEADDGALARDLLDRMAANHADFTLTFRRLCDAAAGGGEADAAVAGLFDDPAAFTGWAAAWRQRLAREGRPVADIRAAMRAANPAFIPRNHRVAAALAAAEAGDLGLADELATVLATPYDDQSRLAHYADPPRPEEVVRETFCGT
jgi:uncharacterized protein YdiU (UPF0061 family)